jgi:sugar/nucleoside kinase (ribokinase family)
MFDIITFGSATQDILVRPKNLTVLKYDKSPTDKEVCFPMGSKIDIDQITFASGGGGTNTAATFANQGLKTAFCGTVGQDLSGREIEKELKARGINTGMMLKTNRKPTNHSIIIFNQGQDRTILAYRGAAELMSHEQIPWKKLKTRWLYLAPLSGLLCLPAGRQATTPFEELVDFASANNINVAVNPSLAQLSLPEFPEIAKKINVLILNQEEASFLTKIPFEKEREIFRAIKAMGPGIVLMTRGGEGVTVANSGHQYAAVPPADRNIVDTTGAGDSFGSGFLSEYMRSGDIEKSIQLGMGNSVGCLSQIGAKNGLLKKGQEFNRVEVEKKSYM